MDCGAAAYTLPLGLIHATSCGMQRHARQHSICRQSASAALAEIALRRLSQLILTDVSIHSAIDWWNTYC